ncbi:MAG: dehydrogenase, partial [Prevotellaceae bacterium]|nr:dehydrogenase [Prevotellaceae bacterium]
MRKQISRNIAIVSAIFMVAFSLMLIVNYFQVKTASPLRSEVIETLKQLNDANANSPQLQENIR